MWVQAKGNVPSGAYSHKGFSRPLSGGMSTPDLSGTRWQAHPRAGFRPGKSVRAHRVNAAESGSGLCFSSHSPHSLPRKRLDRPRETRNSSPGLPSSEASVSNAASGGKEPGHTLVLHQERTFPPIFPQASFLQESIGRPPKGLLAANREDELETSGAAGLTFSGVFRIAVRGISAPRQGRLRGSRGAGCTSGPCTRAAPIPLRRGCSRECGALSIRKGLKIRDVRSLGGWDAEGSSGPSALT